MRVLLITLLCVACAYGQVCRDGYGRVYQSGEEAESYQTWVRCDGGRLRVQGCVSNGQRLPLGTRQDSAGYEMTCTQTSSQGAHMKPTGCLHEGQRLAPGQEGRNQYYVHTCRNNPQGGVSLDITACRDQDGRQVAPGQQFVRGQYQFQCSIRGGHVALEPVGCLHDGAEYPAGSSFEGDKFWYTCDRRGSTIFKQTQGCLDRMGQRIPVGGKFYKNGYVMTCQRVGTTGLRTKVTGCLEDLGGGNYREHSVGSQWVGGEEPFSYTVYCTTCSDGYTVMKSLTRCKLPSHRRTNEIYAAPNPQTELEPGCMRPDGSYLACCGTTYGGGLELKLDSYTAESIAKRRREGYRMC